jgi:hypothetical protein
MNEHTGVSLLGITCQEASRLVSATLDRELTRRERWALKIHTFLCRFCRRFARQVATIREAASLMPIELRKQLFAGTTQLSAVRRKEIKRLLADAAASE